MKLIVKYELCSLYTCVLRKMKVRKKFKVGIFIESSCHLKCVYLCLCLCFAFVFSICIFVFSRKEFPPAVGRPPLQPRKTAASCNSTSLASTLNMKNQPMPPTMISSQKSSSSWRRTDIKKVFKQCVGGLKYVC